MLIATRTLKMRDGTADIPVRIFAPVEADNCWECRFDIEWPDRMSSLSAFGVDAVQALELAFKMIGVTLYTSDYHESGRLMWLEPGNGYGFPVTHNLRDLLEGADRNL